MGVRDKSWPLPSDCCGRCRAWCQADELGPHGATTGTCRVAEPKMGDFGWGTWPRTNMTDWCLTYQRDSDNVTNPYPHHAGSVET